MKNRVVITGLNIISSLGLNAHENWKNLLAGKSGIGSITRFNPAGLQTAIAAEVDDSFDEYARQYCKKRTAQQMTRVTRMNYVCAQEAVLSSGIDFSLFDRSRCGVIMGAVTAGNTSSEKDTTAKNRIIKGMSNAMSAWLSILYKLEGPCYVVNTACASSAYAMGLGFDYIRNGLADCMIVGGADSTVNFEEIEGFNELYALSTLNDEPQKSSCPFSAQRDGFVIGEGAGTLILESEESALKREVPILAELAGYAFSSEAYNIMSPKKDGEGMARTMSMALRNAGADTEEIDYINAHGTSTTLNDRFETMAIKEVFGDRACSIPVSSVKSMIGHTVGAAGAIEGAVTVLSIVNDVITPTINYIVKDPELDLDYVPNESRKHTVNAALSNSFGFGGHNATIVLKKYRQ